MIEMRKWRFKILLVNVKVPTSSPSELFCGLKQNLGSNPTLPCKYFTLNLYNNYNNFKINVLSYIN